MLINKRWNLISLTKKIQFPVTKTGADTHEAPVHFLDRAVLNNGLYTLIRNWPKTYYPVSKFCNMMIKTLIGPISYKKLMIRHGKSTAETLNNLLSPNLKPLYHMLQ